MKVRLKQPLSLRSFILIIYLLALIPIVVFIVFGYFQNLAAGKQLVTNRTLEAAKTLATAFGSLISQTERTLATAGILLSNTDKGQWPTFLAQVNKDNPQFSQIILTTLDNKKIAAHPKTAKLPASIAPSLKQLKKQGTLVTNIIPRGKFRAQFFVLQKIKVGDKQTAVLAGLMVDKTIREQLFVQIGRTGNIGIIDPKGRALILTHVKRLTWSQRDRTFIDSIRKALKGKPATTEGFFDPLVKVVRFGGSAPVKKFGWVANVFVTDEVLQPIKNRSFSVAGQTFLAFLIVLAMVLILSRRLTEPIAVLAHQTEPFRKGRYTHRVPEKFFIREINNLAHSINQAAAETQRLLEIERGIATRLQRALLPIEPPQLEGYQFGTYYASATERALVGGDFYDFIPLSPTSLGVVIGDVQGKGVDSAVTTATIKFVLRDISLRTVSPAQSLNQLNKIYATKYGPEEFITLIYLIINLKSGVFTYATAGHPPLLLCKSSQCQWLEERGPILGVLADAKYPAGESVLEVGDFLLLYTDGLIEARRGKELFGFERLKTFTEKNASANAQDLVNLLYKECLDFGQGRLLDDLAAIVIKRTKAF